MFYHQPEPPAAQVCAVIQAAMEHLATQYANYETKRISDVRVAPTYLPVQLQGAVRADPMPEYPGLVERNQSLVGSSFAPDCAATKPGAPKGHGGYVVVYRPWIDVSGKRAAVAFESGLGMREDLPGTWRNTAFPTMFCSLKYDGKQWVVESVKML